MNILTGADFHGTLPPLPKYLQASRVDLLILAGDIPEHNIDNFHVRGDGFRMIHQTREASFQQEWCEKRLAPWIKKVKPTEVIYVAGNHCFLDPTDLPFITHGLKTGSKTIDIQGLKVGLLAGSMSFTGEWQDEVDEEEMGKRVRALDPDLDLLVSHVPPYGILDDTKFGTRIGSNSLVNSMFGYEPHFTKLKYHFFGHAHEANGSQEKGGIGFHNVATRLMEMTT